jgi:hypothetical protein
LARRVRVVRVVLGDVVFAIVGLSTKRLKMTQDV